MKLHVTTNQFHARFPLSAISGFGFRRCGSVIYRDPKYSLPTEYSGEYSNHTEIIE